MLTAQKNHDHNFLAEKSNPQFFSLWKWHIYIILKSPFDQYIKVYIFQKMFNWNIMCIWMVGSISASFYKNISWSAIFFVKSCLKTGPTHRNSKYPRESHLFNASRGKLVLNSKESEFKYKVFGIQNIQGFCRLGTNLICVNRNRGILQI